MLIKPTDDAMSKFEIILENAIGNATIGPGGVFVEAGVQIGEASRSKCEPNFVHVSVREATTDTSESDEEYKYIDPSKFLDRLMPTPEWILECNDFYFRHILQTVDLDNIGGMFENLTDIVERFVDDKMKELENMDTKDIKFDVNFGSEANHGESSIDTSDGSVLGVFRNSLPDFGNVMNLFSSNG